MKMNTVITKHTDILLFDFVYNYHLSSEVHNATLFLFKDEFVIERH